MLIPSLNAQTFICREIARTRDASHAGSGWQWGGTVHYWTTRRQVEPSNCNRAINCNRDRSIGHVHGIGYLRVAKFRLQCETRPAHEAQIFRT